MNFDSCIVWLNSNENGSHAMPNAFQINNCLFVAIIELNAVYVYPYRFLKIKPINDALAHQYHPIIYPNTGRPIPYFGVLHESHETQLAGVSYSKPLELVSIPCDL